MKKIRAKFTCQSVTNLPRYKEEEDGDYPISETVNLSAVCDTDKTNEDWAKYTPSGEVKMTIDNPRAQGFFKPGADYFLDFEEVVKEKPAEAG